MKKKQAQETMWAPWRMAYIESTVKGEEEKGCIFCNRVAREKDRENLILYRGKTTFVIMNRFPYNSGHLMVVPYRHSGDLQDLGEEENLELMNTLQRCQRVLEKVMRPQGLNIGMNIGRVGGAGIADHLHFHVVPRWNGDTNFMPVLANVKVISEALEQTYDKLKLAFDEE